MPCQELSDVQGERDNHLLNPPLPKCLLPLHFGANNSQGSIHTQSPQLAMMVFPVYISTRTAPA